MTDQSTDQSTRLHDEIGNREFHVICGFQRSSNERRPFIAGKTSAFDSQYKISRKIRDHVLVRNQSCTKMFTCIFIWCYFSCFRPAIFIFLYVFVM